MSHLDLALLFFLTGITLLAGSVVFQMYVVLSEIYTLDAYKDSPRMVWIAAAVFFSFSLALYYFCPNARKKGMIFLLLGAGGLICYALAMYFKQLAQAA